MIKLTFEAETPEEATRIIQLVAESKTVPPTEAPPKLPKGSSDDVTCSAPSAEEEGSSPSNEQAPAELLISDAVKKYAADVGVDYTVIEGSGKNGRILKSDITAAIPEPEPEEDPFADFEDPPAPAEEVEEEDPFADLGDPEPAGPTASREDAKKALQALQMKAKQRLLDKGASDSDAVGKAIEYTRKILKDSAGTDIFGSVTEDQYAAVIEAADAAASRL